MHHNIFIVFSDEVDDSWEYSVRDALYTACKTGDIRTLCTLLQLPVDLEEGVESNTQEKPTSDTTNASCLLNKPIDSAGFTLLHVASAAAQKSVIKLLLDAGADPANKYAHDVNYSYTMAIRYTKYLYLDILIAIRYTK